MRELESASRVPRSTIHFYLRAGVLPPAEKTARNAASYGEDHLRRLEAIGRCRELGAQLPLPLLKRAAELMDRGVEPEVAIELERAVLGAARGAGAHEALSARELARRAAVPQAFVRRLVEVKLLVPLPGPRPTYDASDVQLVRTAHRMVETTGLDPEIATRISETIRDLSRYEMRLRDRAVAGKDEAESAELTLRIQQAANLIHGYLFYRWRLHDIFELQQREAAARKEKNR
jgi:DNA-binding transcriptional MerR regulator